MYGIQQKYYIYNKFVSYTHKYDELLNQDDDLYPFTKYPHDIIPPLYNILPSIIPVISQSTHGYYIIFKSGILYYTRVSCAVRYGVQHLVTYNYIFLNCSPITAEPIQKKKYTKKNRYSLSESYESGTNSYLERSSDAVISFLELLRNAISTVYKSV